MSRAFMLTGEDLDSDLGIKAITMMLENVNEVADVTGGEVTDPDEYLDDDAKRALSHYVLVESGLIVAAAGVAHGVIDNENYNGGVFETRGYTVAVPKDLRAHGFGRDIMELIERQAQQAGDKYHNFRSLDQPRDVYAHLGYTEWQDYWFVKDVSEL